MCTCGYVHMTTNGLMSRDTGFSEAGVTDCSELPALCGCWN